MPKKIDDDDIFRSVCLLVEQQGIDGMTTKMLAREAGINEVSLFRRYGSKRELVFRAINARFADAEFARVSHTGNLLADVTAIIESYRKTVLTHGNLMRVLMNELRRNPELIDAMQSIQENIGNSASILERYIAEGKLAGGSGIQLTEILIAPFAIEGLFPRFPHHPPGKLPASGEMAARFLEGWKKK